MPRVSVIIPTRSRPHLLPRAVQSAFNAGADVEVVIVDDASTDTTAKICSRLSGIRYVRLERNQGTAGARNVGIVASSGDYISFLDDDDVRLTDSLNNQIALLDASPEAGLAYGPVIIGDQDCRPSSDVTPVPPCPTGDLFWTLMRAPLVPPLSIVFRKACALRIGLLNQEISGLDDWDFCVRIAELYSVVAVQEPVGVWRMSTPASGQGSSWKASLDLRIARHQKQLLRLPRAGGASIREREEARRALLNRINDSLVRSAAMWLHYGHHYRYAVANLVMALRLNPWRATRFETARLLAASIARQPRWAESNLRMLGQSVLERHRSGR